MGDDDRVRTVQALLFEHVSNPSQRYVRDGWEIQRLAREIIQKIDQRDGAWRKWNEPREALVKSAIQCWIPVEELRQYLNEMPGPALTRTDVAQRLRAFQDDPYGDRVNADLQAGCLVIFEREKAEGTELPAVIGAIQEWVDQEEERIWRGREGARQNRIEEDRIALEQTLLSGADCKWTPLNKSTEIYCRKNGRTYRLSRSGAGKLDLHRIRSLEDLEGRLVGTYRTRADASKVIAEAAYLPEPRW